MKEEDDADEDEDYRPKISIDRPQVYGAIPGIRRTINSWGLKKFLILYSSLQPSSPWLHRPIYWLIIKP